MEQGILPVETVQESDIGLIVFKEFITDNVLCEWFIKELIIPDLTSVNSAQKSISAFGQDETDILFSYQSNEEKIYLLIKINRGR